MSFARSNRSAALYLLIPALMAVWSAQGRAFPGTAAERYDAPYYFSNPHDRFLNEILRNTDNLIPTVGDPFVPSSGEMFRLEHDMDLNGVIPFGFARVFAAFHGSTMSTWGFHATRDSPMGANWTHNHDIRLLRGNATTVAVSLRMGKVLVFEDLGGFWSLMQNPFGFLQYQGTPYQLVANGTKLELLDPHSNRIHTFEWTSLADGDVTGVERVRDRNGNELVYSYNPDGTLAGITDNRGRTLSFTYAIFGLKPRITRVTDHSGRFVDFGYFATNLTSVTDPNGGVTQYTYDGGANLLTVTEPEGNTIVTYTYGVNAEVLTVMDANGNTSSVNYTPDSVNPTTTTVTDPLGNTFSYDFDSTLRVTAFTDEAANDIQYAHDSNHRVITVTDREGNSSSVTYHAPSGLIETNTDANGHTTTFTYAPQTQEGFEFWIPVTIGLPDGASYGLQYDGQGNVTGFVDGNGQTTTITRDTDGQPLTVTDPLGDVVSRTYNPDGTVATETDGRGNTTSYGYDPLSRVTSITFPGGNTLHFTYDANGNQTLVQDENGNTTTRTYDQNDNVVGVTDPLGNTTTYEHDGNNLLSAVVDPLGNRTELEHDPRNFLVTLTDPDTVDWEALRNQQGFPTTFIDGLGNATVVGFDDEGKPMTTISPEGRATGVGTDAVGNVTETTDGLAQTTQVVYDPRNRIVQHTSPEGRSTSLTRGPNGNITQAQLSEPGVSSQYTFDVDNQLVQMTDPRGGIIGYDYDANGNRTVIEDANGDQTTFTYTVRNQVDVATLPGGLGTAGHTYDAAKRLVSTAGSDGTVRTYGYDANDRLVTGTLLSLGYDADNRIVSSNGIDTGYDAVGRPISTTFAPGKSVNYVYDAAGNMISVADWAGGATTISYDDDHVVTSITHTNGVVTTYGHDAAKQLISISDDGAGNLQNVAITRDADGLITSVNIDLPGTGTPTMETTAYTLNLANQRSDATYDAAGRQIMDGTRTFDYNVLNQLTDYSFFQPNHFTFDAIGNLAQHDDGSALTEYVLNYVGWADHRGPQVAATTENGSPDRYYIYSDQRLLYSMDATDDSRRIYHHDHTNSITTITDDAGSVIGTARYTPYGRLRMKTGVGDGLFGWQGVNGVMHVTNLIYVNGRWYDPIARRFTTCRHNETCALYDPSTQSCVHDADPISDPVAMNGYQAFDGNPLDVRSVTDGVSRTVWYDYTPQSRAPHDPSYDPALQVFTGTSGAMPHVSSMHALINGTASDGQRLSPDPGAMQNALLAKEDWLDDYIKNGTFDMQDNESVMRRVMEYLKPDDSRAKPNIARFPRSVDRHADHIRRSFEPAGIIIDEDGRSFRYIVNSGR